MVYGYIMTVTHNYGADDCEVDTFQYLWFREIDNIVLKKIDKRKQWKSGQRAWRSKKKGWKVEKKEKKWRFTEYILLLRNYVLWIEIVQPEFLFPVGRQKDSYVNFKLKFCFNSSNSW